MLKRNEAANVLKVSAHPIGQRNLRMLNIRQANLSDVRVLRSLIQEMADYECLPFLITEQTLASDGFGAQAKFRVLIADFNGEPAGYAFFFDSYSTFQGRGLFLEDLFVRPQFRKNKIGRALLSHVAAIAQEESCFGVMFHVLHWNQAAIQFYKKMNATFLDDWKTVCLKGDALQLVANAAPDI
jgi:GNAT superfamily N-acetyltransferase